MLLVPQTAAVASNVILLCFGLFFLSCFLFLRKQSCLFYSAVDGEPVLGGALFFFLFLFLCFVLLSVATQGGHESDTTVPSLSTKHERGGIPSPPFVWDFLSRRFRFSPAASFPFRMVPATFRSRFRTMLSLWG